jgi:Fic family protein
MDIKDYKSGVHLTSPEGYKYFMPEKVNHSFTWNDSKLNELLEQASLKLGELNTIARFVPDVDMYIKMHVYKEAVVSSRIEGTQTHIGEALLNIKDINPENRNDWQEVNNYVNAMNHSLDRLSAIPLSSKLLKEAHKRLMQSVRGQNKTPGHFRTSQNWIGGASITDAVFIPPVHFEVNSLMGDLEQFLHNQYAGVPHIIKAAITHYQFETIHPFLDGNGRLGRLMVTIYLVENKVLDKPLLYLSDFFERNKGLYYDNLTLVRQKNDMRQWLLFFLVAIKETATKAVDTLQKIIKLKNSTEKNVIFNMGRKIKSAQLLYDYLFSNPIVSLAEASQACSLSSKATGDLINDFVKTGILKEITGFQRNRLFAYDVYLNLFEPETSPRP